MDKILSELRALREENATLKKQLQAFDDAAIHDKRNDRHESLTHLTAFHHVLKDLPYFIGLLDANLTMLYVNHGLPGFIDDDLIGRHLCHLIPECDWVAVTAGCAQSVADKCSSEYIINLPASQGVVHQIALTLQPVFDAGQTITRWLIIAHDVSDAIETKSYLWRAKQRYSALLESSPVAIVEWSPLDYRIRAWSPGAKALFGYTEEESLLMKITDFTLGSDEQQQLAHMLSEYQVDQAPPEPSTLLSVCKGGGKIYCRWSNVSITNEYGEVESMLSIGQDVTDSELSLIRLNQAKEKAEQLAEDKSSFIATVSHELRTPMHGILNAVEMLSKELANNLPAQHLLDLVGESSQALLHLINDVLDFSKSETDNFALNIAPIDACRLLDNICALLEPEAAKKGVQLLFKTNQSKIPVLADELRLRQVLNNLVGNAIKFTDQGSVELSVEVDECVGGILQLNIAVKDSGIGIANSRLESIFESFTQADNSITRKYGGTGLGLAISQRLTQLMGGRIHVQSKEGEGSIFSLSLNLPKAELDTQCNSDTDVLPNFYGVVMVVDDNPVNITICSKQLEDLGFKVVAATNGQECIDSLQHQLVDLVLMDLQMPVVDGFSATRQIRMLGERFMELPIIAMTANRFEQAAHYYQEIGLNAYITKPFNSQVLAQVIESVVPCLVTDTSV